MGWSLLQFFFTMPVQLMSAINSLAEAVAHLVKATPSLNIHCSRTPSKYRMLYGAVRALRVDDAT